MSIKDLLQQKHVQILDIAKSNGVKKISVFGSVVRGEERLDSDIDFLVEFENDRSLFDLIRLKLELEDLLGHSVDVVTGPSVHWKIRDQIINEAIQL